MRPGVTAVAEEPLGEDPDADEAARLESEVPTEPVEAEARLMPDSEDPETEAPDENAEREPIEIMAPACPQKVNQHLRETGGTGSPRAAPSHQASSAATPGRVLPSIHSRKAPPAEET